MIDWLKNITKDYPDFWKAYLGTFSSKSNRFVVLNTKLSGTNPEKDLILEISAVNVIDNSVQINDLCEIVIMQYKYIHDNGLVNEYILIKNKNKVSEDIAIQIFVEFLKNAIIVGININSMIEMINVSLEKMNCGRLKNQALDLGVMYQKYTDDYDINHSFSKQLQLNNIQIEESNSCTEDAFSAALLFIKLKQKLKLQIKNN